MYVSFSGCERVVGGEDVGMGVKGIGKGVFRRVEANLT